MTTRLPRPAFYAALGVTIFLVASDLVWIGLTLLTVSTTSGPFEPLGQALLVQQLSTDVLIGLGVFLVLWLLAPVTAEGSLLRTIGAGALAAVGAAVLLVLFEAVQALVVAREVSGSLYDLVPLDLSPIHLLTTAVLRTLGVLPLTVLAAILLREWLRSKVATSSSESSAEEPVEAV